MAEQEPPQDKPTPPQFGEKLPTPNRRSMQRPAASMWRAGEELPLFSGTPIPAVEQPFVPEDRSMKQAALPGMPPVDYEHILAKDKQLRRRRQGAELPAAATLFHALLAEPQEDEATPNPVQELVRPYVDLMTLRRLAATGEDIRAALRENTDPPEEIAKLLETIRALLRPADGERIKSPADMAALLMVEMAHLDQEQMRVTCLDVKNKVQKIHLVYQGSVNASLIRVSEIFKEPVRLNSAAIILAHNHPSGEPEPSPEDVLVTQEIVSAGELLDVDVLDHLVIGQGRWVSMRERGLGWTT